MPDSRSTSDLIAEAAQHIKAGRLAEAEKRTAQALARDPNNHVALNLHGLIASRLGYGDLAVALFESAVAADPSNLGCHLNLVEACRMEWRLDEALRFAHRAAELAPRHAGPEFSLGFVHNDRGAIDEAIACFRRAIALEPGHAGAHMLLGQALLSRGDCKPGWPEYEWRFRLPGLTPLVQPTDKPRWDGANCADGTLLIVCGEGYGDTIQFARYIPLAARRCRNIIIGCSDEMRPLIAQQEGADLTFRAWAELPAFDAYCVLSSLPGVFETDVAAPPADIPYIRADAGRARRWGEHLDALIPPRHFRVGVAWAGRPTHSNDRRRSIELRQLLPLTAIPGVALVSLQKGVTPEHRLKGPAPFIDLTEQVGDFVDTAAIIDNLDLVVSVDTAMAHLAGAMGKPVWTLLPYAADWRWRRDRDDSPWYPSMRLFRQQQPGQWSGVIEAVTARLREAVIGKRK